MHPLPTCTSRPPPFTCLNASLSSHTLPGTSAELLRMHEVAQGAYYKYLQRIEETPDQLVLPTAQQAQHADQQKLANMLARSKIWGDLMQVRHVWGANAVRKHCVEGFMHRLHCL
jgi:hypothetical protein